MSTNSASETLEDINNCFNKLADLPIPTVAAINGAAMGGGAEFALCCDFRVIAESAMIGFPETGLGIIPGAGGTQRLPKLIGPAKAKYWIFSGRKFTAEEALEEGVVDFISEESELIETAIDISDEFLANAPLALRAAKRAILAGLETDLKKGLRIEQDAYETTLNTEDRNEALNAFDEKRKPIWKGK